MKLYFSKSQVPELAGLTPLRRKLVYQCALEALLTEQPSTIRICSFCLFGGILIGALAGWMTVIGNGPAHSLLVVTACGFAGAMTGVLIGAQFLTARLRPYVRRVLEERKDELAQIS